MDPFDPREEKLAGGFDFEQKQSNIDRYDAYTRDSLTRQLAREREREYTTIVVWLVSRRKRIDTRFDRDGALEKTMGVYCRIEHTRRIIIYRRKPLTSLSTQVLQQPFNLDTRVGKYTSRRKWRGSEQVEEGREEVR